MSALIFNWITYYLGLYVVLDLIFNILKNLSAFVKDRYRPLDFLYTYGKRSYVVITGASDGLGKCYAFAFAKKGFNLILIARNKAKLEKVQSEIKALHPRCEIHLVVKDFTKSFEPGFFDSIQELSDNFDVSIVVNNVGISGFGTPFLNGVLTKIDLPVVANTVAVNMVAQASFHRIFSTRMNSRPSRSAFIDVSSEMSDIYLPTAETYAATKDANRFLTNALASSLRKPNIDYLSHVCGATHTNFFDGSMDDPFYAQKSDLVVDHELKSLGFLNESRGTPVHTILGCSASILFGALALPLEALLSVIAKIFLKI